MATATVHYSYGFACDFISRDAAYPNQLNGGFVCCACDAPLLHPAALVFVPYGIVFVQVKVQVLQSLAIRATMTDDVERWILGTSVIKLLRVCGSLAGPNVLCTTHS